MSYYQVGELAILQNSGNVELDGVLVRITGALEPRRNVRGEMTTAYLISVQRNGITRGAKPENLRKPPPFEGRRIKVSWSMCAWRPSIAMTHYMELSRELKLAQQASTALRGRPL